MRRIVLAAVLLAVTSAANAGLSFLSGVTDTRTEIFNNITGLPDLAIGTNVAVGSLNTNETGTITFTYLGQESSYADQFNLTINGLSLTESNLVGDSISASVTSLGAIGFSFADNMGGLATNGGTWSTGTSIGLIGQSMTVASGGAAGNYAFVIGYNDSAGSATLGDWDDYVVGVNFATAPIPEPEIYAMMAAGLALMGWVGRRRKLQAA
jgi:hypothetical protein